MVNGGITMRLRSSPLICVTVGKRLRDHNVWDGGTRCKQWSAFCSRGLTKRCGMYSFKIKAIGAALMTNPY